MKLKLITLLFIAVASFQVKAQDSASSILETALTQAKAENKNVFIKYSASWCGWCKKMDKQMKSDACNAFFDANYVIVNLVVKESQKNKNLENPGANDLFDTHTGGKRAGLPFWVILDSSGKMLEDSFNSNDENLGCPATKAEVEDFIVILKNTSNLTQDDLAIIRKTFLAK